MDAALDPTTGDYTGQRITTLGNAVYLRLMTPLGGYWADPTLGSRLHELQREKDVPRVLTLLRQYSEQALAPLLADGRAQRITVTATRTQPGLAQLAIAVVDQTGHEATFKHPVRVI